MLGGDPILPENLAPSKHPAHLDHPGIDHFSRRELMDCGCAAAETWLGKPVIAINTATYWHALRNNGIADQMDGFGRLMAEF